jgi:hypothetical protein
MLVVMIGVRETVASGFKKLNPCLKSFLNVD